MRPTVDTTQTLAPLGREQLRNTPASRDSVLNRITAAKICGLGGGRFDTASKLRSGFGARALIINGMQSEPDNNSDVALLNEDPGSVVAGMALAAFATGVTSVTLALPDNAHLSNKVATAIDVAISDESAWLTALISADTPVNFSCRYLPAGHASGEEHHLAIALELLEKPLAANREVTAAPLVQSGIVCINLATAYAIARAVHAGERLTHRLISINGVADWVELGTPLHSIVKDKQGLDGLWINGRHSGKPANNDPADACAHAGMFCIDTAPPAPVAPCINCSACVPACPVDLRPDELHQQLEQGETPAAHLRLTDCIECGACNAVCPSGLRLAQSFRQARAEQQANAIKDRLAQKAKARSDARSARLAALDKQRATRVQRRSTKGKRAW